MGLIRIDRNPSRRHLATFGLLWLVFFTIACGVVFARGGPRAVAGALVVAAVGVPAVGWVFPRFMRLVYLAMAYLALPIGFVVSHLLVAAVYYGLITPTGLLMRVFGYDPMRRRFDATAESYWVSRGQRDDAKHYFRQF